MDPKRFGFLIDPIYDAHETEEEHPECARRIRAIQAGLDSHRFGPMFKRFQAGSADMDAIQLVHSKEYIQEFRSACQSGLSYFHSYDNCISERSFEAACHAVGGVLGHLEAVMAEEIDSGFCAIRPPGHHAERNKAMGFCYFNNVGPSIFSRKNRAFFISASMSIRASCFQGQGGGARLASEPERVLRSTSPCPHLRATTEYCRRSTTP